MAEVISLADVVKARRRAHERQSTAACIDIITASLTVTLQLFSAAPASERPVRARQARQLADLLEYLVRSA